MNYFLDSLFTLGQATSLVALAWGGSLVLRQSMGDLLCPGRTFLGPLMRRAWCARPAVHRHIGV